jgi:3-methyladenine DNA glycosylase AlkC
MVRQAASRNVFFGESIAALMESRETMMDAYSRAEALKVRRFSDQALRHNLRWSKQWWRTKSG